jgi:hypothetical protein
MWLHVTAFSTFPFRRTGEGNFYQQQHHQHRRFFYHGKQQHFNSARGSGGGGSFFFLRFTRPDITRYPRCFVSSFFFAFFFAFALRFFFRYCFLSLFLLAGGCFAFIRYEEMSRDANKTNKQDAKTNKHTQKYITQKLQRRQYAGFMLFLPSNQFSLFLSIFVYFFFFYTRISVLS